MGTQHPLVARSLDNLGGILSDQGAATKVTRDLLIRLYETSGRPEKAASYRPGK